MTDVIALLVVGDWDSWCADCGKGADPDEKTHTRVLGHTWGETGCGVTWTHVAQAVDSSGSSRPIREEMRPDLVWVAEPQPRPKRSAW